VTVARSAGAQRILAEAQASALAINTRSNRDSNLQQISRQMAQAGGETK
jgi:hypothetical protein